MVSRSAFKYQVSGECFATQEQVKERVRHILEKYPLGAPFTDGDFTFMRALLDRHPEADRKIGAGVAAIVIRQHPEFRNAVATYLQRTDGTWTDWSWSQCVAGKKITNDPVEALRRQVAGQVIAYRRRYFEANCVEGGRAPCELTGALLLSHESHVDHEPPMTFQAIVKDFCQALGIGLEAIAVTVPADNQLYAEMTDAKQIAAWERYHQEHARLRVVSKFANLSTIRRAARLL